MTQRIGRVLRASPFKTGAKIYVAYALNTIEERLQNAIRDITATAPEEEPLEEAE